LTLWFPFDNRAKTAGSFMIFSVIANAISVSIGGEPRATSSRNPGAPALVTGCRIYLDV
jgi:hypothetical protein